MGDLPHLRLDVSRIRCTLRANRCGAMGGELNGAPSHIPYRRRLREVPELA